MSAAVLSREAHARRWAVPAAVLAGGLPLVATILQVVFQVGAPLSRPAQLLFLNDHPGPLIASAALQGVGTLAAGLVLLHLHRTTRARRPQLRGALSLLGLAGAVGGGVATVVAQGLVLGQVGRFASHGGQSYQEATDALGATGAFSSTALVAASSVLRVASLMLAIAIGVLALNAMRVGLLTRLMGYVGIFAAVLVALSAVQGGGGQFTVVESFWLVALALLFTGRWPSGLPPAWSTGQAEPWPSMQEQREAAARGGADPPGRRGVSAPAPAPAVPSADRPSANAPARPGAARRKRKKRR